MRPGCAWLGALALCAACRDLPNIARDACGNGVLEPRAGEDCDTFAPTGLTCRPADAVNACHFDCTHDASGARRACPEGWGCDRDSVCRAPADGFEEPAELGLSRVTSVAAGDFDHDPRFDSRSELLSTTSPDLFGRAGLRFHYFDADGRLAETHEFRKDVATPVVFDLSGDARDDVVFTDLSIGAILGNADHDTVPETYSSYRVPDSHFRMVVVADAPVGVALSNVVFATLDGELGMYVPRVDVARLSKIGELDDDIANLLDAPITADVFPGDDSPCREILFAYRGASAFDVVDVCAPANAEELDWRERAITTHVALDPPAPLDASPQVADVNHDGHLDVLVGADQRAYVAYGDGQTFAPAVPLVLKAANPDQDFDRILVGPLAAGDFSGDGYADFVLPIGLLMSELDASTNTLRYRVRYGNVGIPWNVAHVADVNGNGMADVIAASRDEPTIYLFSGKNSPSLVASRVQTEGPVTFLDHGDFDGDGVGDLAYVEAHPSEERDAVVVAFGLFGRPPEERVTVARVQGSEQLVVYEDDGLSQLALTSYQSDGAESVGMLTIMNGGSDRIPLAAHNLVTFSDDGALLDMAAVALGAGNYLPGPPGTTHDGDVFAIGTADGLHFDLWIIPDMTSGDTTPKHLALPLDEDLSPVVAVAGRIAELSVASASANLDVDVADEAVWVMPSRDNERCALLVYDLEAGEQPELTLHGELRLARPCGKPQVAAADLDADGATDLVLLTGTSDGGAGQVTIYWNDGNGSFSEDESTLVTDHPARAFTILAPTSVRPIGVAWIGAEEAELSSVIPETRALDLASQSWAVSEGSGIASGDFDGDGLADLALVWNGDVHIVRTRLEGT